MQLLTNTLPPKNILDEMKPKSIYYSFCKMKSDYEE